MQSRTTSARKQENRGCFGCEPLKVILTHHAADRIAERIATPGHFVLRGTPYVRVMEIWDREEQRIRHGILATSGSLLLGELRQKQGEFIAVTLLTAGQLRVIGKGVSRLIPRSAALYEVY